LVKVESESLTKASRTDARLIFNHLVVGAKFSTVSPS
jgi:hypothetical protein